MVLIPYFFPLPIVSNEKVPNLEDLATHTQEAFIKLSTKLL